LRYFLEVSAERFEEIKSFIEARHTFTPSQLIVIFKNRLDKKNVNLLNIIIELSEAGIPIEILDTINEDELKNLLILKKKVNNKFFQLFIQARIREQKDLKEKIDLYLKIQEDINKI
jgi:hypothetical protein